MYESARMQETDGRRTLWAERERATKIRRPTRAELARRAYEKG